jgi:hypothetical protein
MATVNPQWAQQMQRQIETENALRSRQARWGAAPSGPTVSPPPAAQPSRLSQLGATLRTEATKVAGKARPVLNSGLGRLATGAAALGAVADSAAEDSTARYAQRFGVSEPTGDGSVGDIAKFTALRAGGFASDLANNLTLGLAGKLYRDNDTPRTPVNTPAATPAPAAAASTALAPPPGSRVVDENNGNPIVALRRAGTTEYTTAADASKPLGRGNLSVYQSSGSAPVAGTAATVATPADDLRAPDASARAAELNANYDRLAAPLVRGLQSGKLTAAGMRALQGLESDRARSLDGMDDNATRQYGAQLGFRAAQEQARVASEDRAIAREDRNAIAREGLGLRRDAMAAAAAQQEREDLNSMIDDLASDAQTDKDGKVSYVRNPQKAAQLAKIAETFLATGQPLNRETMEAAMAANVPIDNLSRRSAANGLPVSSKLRNLEYVGEVTLPSVVRGNNNITLKDYAKSLFEDKSSLKNQVFRDPVTDVYDTGSNIFTNDQDAVNLYRKGK